jgi:large subunit ribosomal protein L25
MAEMLTLEAQPRNVEMNPRALRRANLIPGVMYGREFETRSLQFEQRTLMRLVQQAGTSNLVALSVEGEKDTHDVLIRDIQRDPVTGSIVHVDFYRTLADVAITASIPIVVTGESPMVELGGTVALLLEFLDIECLPRDMPASFEVDAGQLDSFDALLTVADLDIPEGVTSLAADDTEIARVIAPRQEEEEEVEEEEILLEGEEGEAVEGEDGAASEEGEATDEGDA